MKSIKIILALSLILSVVKTQAQVGIGTDNPKNDLHVNDGLRLETVPKGSTADAQARMLAMTPEGDIVQVTTESVLSSLNIPVLAFNAHFGVTNPPLDVPFFAGCDPCTNDTNMNLNFEDSETIVSSPFVNLLGSNNGTNNDEIFQFVEAGTYRFELNMSAIYGGDCDYRINIVFEYYDSAGNFKYDEVIRLYGGEPTTVVGSTYGVPGYITDTRNHAAGDLLVMFIEVATVSNTAEASVESGRVIGASYDSQVTITKY